MGELVISAIMSFTFAFIKTNKMDLLKLKSQAQDNPTQPVDLGTLSLLTTHFFSLLLTLPNSSQCVLNPPHFSSLILTSTHSSLLLLTPPHSSSFFLTPPHSSSLLLTPPHSSSLHSYTSLCLLTSPNSA